MTVSEDELKSGKYVFYVDRWVKATDIWPENHETELPWYYKIPLIGTILSNIDESERQKRLKKGLTVKSKRTEDAKMTDNYKNITKEEFDTAIKVLEAYSNSEDYFSFYEMDAAIDGLIREFSAKSDKMRQIT